MAVIHIFKNGTTTTKLKDVYVPKEIVEQVVSIARRKTLKQEGEKTNGKSE